MKHGIFSKVVLLRDEPRGGLESLLNGLRDDLQPVGTLETLLVDKLAALFWRQRRLLIAEKAETLNGRELAKEDQERNYERVADGIRSLAPFGRPLFLAINNPMILNDCLVLLRTLKSEMDRRGVRPEWDTRILERIYGEYCENNPIRTLMHSYTTLIVQKHCADVNVQSRESDSLEKDKKQFLRDLDGEIGRLDLCKIGHAMRESKRKQLVSLSRSVPEAVQLDRFLRYETALGREIQRVLGQLERFQRMRLGQPSPPQIDVTISSDG